MKCISRFVKTAEFGDFNERANVLKFVFHSFSRQKGQLRRKWLGIIVL